MDPQNWRPDWVFAITTLLIRFFGIFIVLAILQICMQISGYIFSRLTPKEGPSLEGPPPSGGSVEDREEEQEIAAAIGVALSLYRAEMDQPLKLPTVSPSEWAISGRVAQLQSRLQRNWR